MKFEKICRTCMAEKESLQTIFHVIDMLKECTSIQVDIGDGLPELICLECISKLNSSFEFIKQCKVSDETLKEYVVKGDTYINVSNVCFNKISSLCENNYEEKDFDIKSENSYNIEPEFLESTHDSDTIKKDDGGDEKEILGENRNNDTCNSKLKVEITWKINNVRSEDSADNYYDFNNSDSDDEPLAQRKQKQSPGFSKVDENILSVHKEQNINKKKSKSTFKKQAKVTKGFMKQIKTQRGKPKSKDGLPCPKCTQSFELESDLEIHMISHPKTDELICTKCSKSFSNLAYLRKHVTTHLVNKPYKCSFCSKSFANAGGRLSHLRTHTGEKPYVCSTCGKRFSDSSGLSAHMKSHSDVKNFACTYCPKFFKFPNDLRNHLRIHTGEKPFLCTVCGESFAQAYCVTKHMRKHTGERPYSCTECDRKFRLNHQLKFHMRTHTGEKPHVCKVCEMGFARPESLVRHNRCHTGELPYRCNICFKSYPVSSSLTRHKRTHDTKIPPMCNEAVLKSLSNQTEALEITGRNDAHTVSQL